MSTSQSPPVTVEQIREARARIAGIVRETPLLHKESLSPWADGHPVHLKCEHLQRTGSFKLRGAVNLVAQLTAEERARGVVAASAGNHAQGVAVAAAEFDVEATIFMPTDATLSKVEATRSYGATVRLEGNGLAQTLEAAHAFAKERGAVFVHPFDDPRIVAGQGTLGLEVAEALPDLDTLVVPVGGGGLAAGVATAVRALRPDCRIVAVQAAACPSLQQSLDAGAPVAVQPGRSMADGICVKQPGGFTFGMLRELVDEVVLVEEEELSTAILWSMERAKQVVEGAGAAALAALLAGKLRVGGPVALLSGGGNVDPVTLMAVIRHGLTAMGRFLYIGTVLTDRPGELSRLLSLLASQQVNILSIEHHREGVHTRPGQARVDLTVLTRNAEHVSDVVATLEREGYPVLGDAH